MNEFEDNPKLGIRRNLPGVNKLDDPIYFETEQDLLDTLYHWIKQQLPLHPSQFVCGRSDCGYNHLFSPDAIVLKSNEIFYKVWDGVYCKDKNEQFISYLIAVVNHPELITKLVKANE